MKLEEFVIDVSDVQPIDIDDLLDMLYRHGYADERGYAPTCDEMWDRYINIYGTSPTKLVCYLDDNGYQVLAPADEGTGKGRRLMDGLRQLTYEQAYRRFDY